MKQLFYFLALLVVVGCTQSSKTNKIESKQPITKADSVDVIFGSKISANYKFPSHWKAPQDTTTEDDNIANENWFKALGDFGRFEMLKTITKPEIRNIEYLKIKDDSADSLIHPIDSVRIRLPNIGPYQCYYSQQITAKYDSPDDDFYSYKIRAGNIIFYDPQTSNAKVINVFFDQEALSGGYRFFYIGLDKAIHVFSGEFDELDMSFKHEYIIKVNDSGKIVITKIKPL